MPLHDIQLFGLSHCLWCPPVCLGHSFPLVSVFSVLVLSSYSHYRSSLHFLLKSFQKVFQTMDGKKREHLFWVTAYLKETLTHTNNPPSNTISLTHTTTTDKSIPKRIMSCMKTDTHACMHREPGCLKSQKVCDMSYTAAKQHLLQAKYETENPATLHIIFLRRTVLRFIFKALCRECRGHKARDV